MSKAKPANKIINKAAKRNTFPNITTAYAALNPKADPDRDASTTIQQNNSQAP